MRNIRYSIILPSIAIVFFVLYFPCQFLLGSTNPFLCVPLLLPSLPFNFEFLFDMFESEYGHMIFTIIAWLVIGIIIDIVRYSIKYFKNTTITY